MRNEKTSLFGSKFNTSFSIVKADLELPEDVLPAENVETDAQTSRESEALLPRVKMKNNNNLDKNKRSRWFDRMWQSNQPDRYTHPISFNTLVNYLNVTVDEAGMAECGIMRRPLKPEV